jgi:serine O-acetyltransferase
MTDTLSCWQLIREDVSRYTGSRAFHLWKTARAGYYDEALVVGVLFRVCQAIHRIKNPILRFPLKLIFSVILYRTFTISLGIYLDLDATVGKGLYIGHYGGIFIGPVVLGDYCNISQGVTVGSGRLGTVREGRPVIGDRVYIAPGAKIFGQITIGSNVSIGANAVVSKNIPDNSIVVGNPGRIVGQQEKNIHIHNVFE